MTDDDRLRCRWCGFSVLKFYTGKDGKPRGGWGRLNAHQETRHPDEIEELREQADAAEKRREV